jgi:hypothetical protein
MSFVLPLILYLLLVTQSHASISNGTHCLRVYSPYQNADSGLGLQNFKKKIMEIAAHPEFDKPDFDLDATGPRLRFLHPLVEHMIGKAEKILTEIGNPHISEIYIYYKDAWLKQLKTDTMSYKNMLELPSLISSFLHRAKKHDDLSKFVPTKMTFYAGVGPKIFPLPMFFTPGFEMRTRLWIMGRPMISIVKDEFYSFLDAAHYDINENIGHDWGHISTMYMHFKEKDYRHSVNKSLLEYFDKQVGAEKTIGFFFLHQLIPETGLVYQNLQTAKKSVEDSLNISLNKFLIASPPPNHNAKIISTLEEKGFPEIITHRLWIIETLGLLGTRIEVAPGQFIRAEKSRYGDKVELVEGTEELFVNYFSQMKEKFQADIFEILESTYSPPSPTK